MAILHVHVLLFFKPSLLNGLSASELLKTIEPADVEWREFATVNISPPAHLRLRFSTEVFLKRALLLSRLEELAPTPNTLTVVVSNALVTRDSDDRPAPSQTVSLIRETFRQSPGLCGLIAIDSPDIQPVFDIDLPQTLDVRTPAQARQTIRSLRESLIRLAKSLYLRSSLKATAESPRDLVDVVPVETTSELSECLKLRYAVYDLLGYMHWGDAQTKSRVDLDRWDKVSLHYRAINKLDGTLLGTVRLIASGVTELDSCPPRFKHPLKLQRAYEVMCGEIAAECRIPHDQLDANPPAAMPIVLTFPLRQERRQFAVRGVEISRLVVHPAIKGTGVARTLLTCAIADATQLRRQQILLECAPFHEAFYAQFDFKKVPLQQGDYYRVPELRQMAVAMRRELEVAEPAGLSPREVRNRSGTEIQVTTVSTN